MPDHRLGYNIHLHSKGHCYNRQGRLTKHKQMFLFARYALARIECFYLFLFVLFLVCLFTTSELFKIVPFGLNEIENEGYLKPFTMNWSHAQRDDFMSS